MLLLFLFSLTPFPQQYGGQGWWLIHIVVTFLLTGSDAGLLLFMKKFCFLSAFYFYKSFNYISLADRILFIH